MNWNERYCPSWPGGVAVPQRKYCEATTAGTDGVVVQTRTKCLNHHPVRSLSMLRDFFCCRGHPSWPGGAMALVPAFTPFRQVPSELGRGDPRGLWSAFQGRT